jgi:hypothetical protein
LACDQQERVLTCSGSSEGGDVRIVQNESSSHTRASDMVRTKKGYLYGDSSDSGAGLSYTS